MRDSSSPLAEFIDAFLAAKDFAAKSRSDYGRLLREFDSFTEHGNLDSALTMANAKRWTQRKREDGLNAAINATMYLKSFATWACKSDYKCGPEGESVLVHLKAPKSNKRVRHAFTQQQLDVIWRALASPSAPAGYRAAVLLRVLLATGIQRDAARALLLDDFKKDVRGRRGHITVREKPYTDVGARKLRLDADTVDAIRQYLEVRPAYEGKPPEPLLINKNGKAFTENGFGSSVRRIAKYIGVETGMPWTTEDMRFTWRQEASALISDEELREKCTKTLEAPEGTADYEDAVMDACKVLEIRVRKASNPPKERRSGWRLMQFAFGEPTPPLRLSSESAEQDGVMHMYSGLMAVYRNRTTHEKRGDLDQREAKQIVLWVDHLLALLKLNEGIARGSGITRPRNIPK